MVYEHTILPLLANNLNPPILPDSESVILSRYLVSYIILIGMTDLS
jgi:hypothetical protein